MALEYTNTELLLDGYCENIESGFHVEHFPDYDYVVTPFDDFVGDNIVLFVQELGNNEIEIYEDGMIDDLFMMIPVETEQQSNFYNRLIMQIGYAFGVDISKKFVHVTGQLENFERLFNQVLQATIAVKNLFYLAEPDSSE